MTAIREDSGFGLPEFLISALIFLIVGSSIFGMLNDVQRSASFQTEVQSVLNNTRLAMQVAGRFIRQAGNDPFKTGISGITAISDEEVRIESDLTGSAAPGNPDKGDPDGDSLDSGESVTIRYNSATKSLETVTRGGSVQIVAGSISGLTFRYYNSSGNPASAGEEIRKINVTITGSSSMPDPRTQRNFGVQLSSDFEIAT